MIIAMCCTRNWYKYLPTVIYSLFKNNNVQKLYLFTEDDSVKDIWSNKIRFINTNKIKKYISWRSPNYNTRYTRMTLIRCYLSKLLEESKVLYIDTDTIIDGNLDKLWNTNLDKYAVAGVKEKGDWDRHLKLKGFNDKYINCGVLLMNLDYIRKHKLDDKMIEMLNKEYHEYPDQDTINIVCKSKIKYIHNTYNSTTTTGIVENAKIIHYIAGDKGWVKESSRSEVWYKYYYERRKDMVKIRVTSPVGFNDLVAKRIRKFGEEFEVTEERAEFLESKGVIEIIEVQPKMEPIIVEEPKEEVAEKIVEKKTNKKKKKIDTKNK